MPTEEPPKRETLGQLERTNLEFDNAAVIRERDRLVDERAAALRDCEGLKSALEQLRADLALQCGKTEFFKGLLSLGPLSEEISPGSLFRRTLEQPNGALVRPPGECKLPWFLVIKERRATQGAAETRTALVSPASQIELLISKTNSGVWILEIENYGAREGRPGRTESYGRGSLSAMMKLAEKVVAEGFPTGGYFRKWHGSDDGG